MIGGIITGGYGPGGSPSSIITMGLLGGDPPPPGLPAGSTDWYYTPFPEFPPLWQYLPFLQSQGSYFPGGTAIPLRSYPYTSIPLREDAPTAIPFGA